VLDWGPLVAAVVTGVVGLCSGFVGGAMALIGTVLAHRLAYRRERDEWGRERRRERLDPVRLFVMACLDFADSICLPLQLEGERWSEAEYEDWKEIVADQAEGWRHLPSGGSSVVLFVDDDELMKLLRSIARLTARFYVYYRWLVSGRSVPHRAVKERERLRDLAAEARARMDALVDGV